MGIQVSFKRADVSKLILVEYHHKASCGECNECLTDMQGCSSPARWTGVVLKDAEGEITVAGEPESIDLWCDANHWGNNRAIIIPMLERHGVEFVEG
jgi:hypothetical protein